MARVHARLNLRICSMIAGIGVDMIEIVRVGQKVNENAYFREKVYSAVEISYCQAQRKPAMHYAARWAVKEAFLKAYGVRFIRHHHLFEIETLHNEHGRPYIQLHGQMLRQFEEAGLGQIHVSITHTEEYALAYVVIEKGIVSDSTNNW